MPKFKYTATDSAGNEKSSIIDAVNRPAALLRIKEMGLTPVTVTETTPQSAAKAAPGPTTRTVVKAAPVSLRSIKIPLPSIFGGRISNRQLMIFTRQLATMVDAGVPLLRALQIIQKQEANATLKRVTGELCEAVEGGSTFDEALAQHPKIFNKLYVNMAKAGGIGGMLQITLTRLAEFIEKAEAIKTKVKAAMIYPIIVVIAAVAILSFMLIYIVPKFSDIFKDLLGGKELPPLTRFVMKASNVIVHQAPWIGIAIVVVIILFNVLSRTKTGRYWIDKIKLKLPVIGPLLLRVSISRFTRTLGTLQNSGVLILSALNIVRDTAGNEVIARAIQSVHDSIKEGESVAGPLGLSGVFPPMVVGMISVGEETGRLPEMLIKIADTYDGEVDSAVEGLTSIIEPVLIIFLAVFVGTIVVSMFMPLISVMKTMNQQQY